MERVDLAWKLYVRESDPGILTSLLGLLDDSAPEMRLGVVHALGNMGKEELVRPLLDQLQREAEQAVQLEILKAVEILGEGKVEGNWNFKIYGGDAFSPADRDRFVSALQKIRTEATVDTLEHLAEEFLEKMAGQLASEAEVQVVRADLEGALKLYDRALAIKPDSKNVHTSLGKFQYFNGERAKGLATLRVNGMYCKCQSLSPNGHRRASDRSRLVTGHATGRILPECADGAGDTGRGAQRILRILLGRHDLLRA